MTKVLRRNIVRFRRYRLLKRLEYSSSEGLSIYQGQRLRKLLEYGLATPRAEKEGGAHLFRAEGLLPAQILKTLPILQKEVVQKKLASLVSAKGRTRRSIEDRTSGSTGAPTIFIRDLACLDAERAAAELFYRDWLGRERREPVARIWATEADQAPTGEKVGGFFRKRISEIWLSAFNLNDADMADFFKLWQSHEPSILIGYPEAVFECAKYLRRNRIRIPHLKGIVTAGAKLFPEMRSEVERSFMAPVLERYGSRETGLVAMECLEGRRLHVVAPNVYVEILNESGAPALPGEEGSVVVTPFYSYKMPFLRYVMGDRAKWALDQACVCGRSWPVIEEIVGRAQDCFRLRDGGTVSGMLGYYIMRDCFDFSKISQFQFIQESYERVTAQIQLSMPHDEPDREFFDAIVKARDRFSQSMGPNCSIHFKFVDHIPRLSSGKHRYLMSLVD